ncbi:TonB-dependent receptor [uncultured Butyricimonas sp.]|uniref:SusC/RagA family TonB-linked outer membrane protein n=1 Tax=uncultured Butyricimonas sp. TaxID=1268785 RepID=UPI0026DD6845|nr:TonB-dependent receptor [uncultured Butyricimonas sp.]
MKKRTKPKVFSGLLCTYRRAFSVFSLFVVLLLGSASLLAQQANQKTISFDFKDFSVLRALHEINQLGGNVVTFREEVVMKEAKKITLKREKITVFEAVKACLEGTGLTCSQQANGKILVGPKQESTLIQVSGRIVDEKGNPIAGATIMVVGTTQGVASDAEGRYTIAAKPDDVLRVSFIGFETKIVDIKGKEKLNIRLESTEENLEEVTVVAFGEQKKESVVSAITTVRPMDLKSSNSDLTASFAGKIAGIVGWQTGGLPGALTEEEMNTKFYIRGITSFQTDANIDPLILIDGVESSKLDLSRIAPEDIESFSVMKDASATAMYGARGANGVILVTTKKGEAGSVYASVRYEAVASMPTKEIDVVDPITYMKMYNKALVGRDPEATPKYSVERINRTGSPDYPSWVYPANNWYDVLFKDYSVNHRFGLNIRGGSDIIQYYVSLNYNRDKGMLKTDRLNDFDCNITNSTTSFRANLNINLNAGIKLVVNSSASLDKYHGPYESAQEAYALAFAASPVDFAPMYPGDDNSNWPHLRFGSSLSLQKNPYSLIHSGYLERTRYSVTNKAEYIHNLSRLLKGLEVRASISLTQTGYYSTPNTTSPYLYALENYDFETGKHKLALLNSMISDRTLKLGQTSSTASTQTTYELRGLHTAAWGDHQTSLTVVLNALESTASPASSILNGMEHRNLGLSVRGSYGYKDRYFVEASFGYNGSERFAKQNKMGFFPAAGGAWIVSKEPFMSATSNWLSFMKFRISYGQVGNDGIIKEPRFVYLPLLDRQVTAWNPMPGGTEMKRYRIYSYANEDIKWEIAEQVNLGLEMKLFDGLLDFTLDAYQEIRHNIIGSRTTIPSSMGFEIAPLANIGKAKSQGIDFSGKVQHAFSNDFWMILNGTLTYNKATYLKIEEATNKLVWQLKKGHELSQQVGYIAEGLFHDQAEIDNAPVQGGDVMPGDIRYRDLNNDGVIDVNDATHIGFPETPRLTYGFSGFVNYKNWEFSFSFQGSGRRSFFMNPALISPFVGDNAMLTAIYKDHWSEDNMSRKPFWPRLSTRNLVTHNPQEDWYNENNNEIRKSTYFMRECSFLRCTALELAYNLPDLLKNKLKMQNVKFFVRANNPFLITNFKVWDVELGESGFNYPIQKTYTVGLNFSF